MKKALAAVMLTVLATALTVVLLLLQEQGRLDLHDPVTRHLPWFGARGALVPTR